MDDGYNSYQYDTLSGEGVGIASGLFAFFILFTVLSYAIFAFLLGKIFKKSGVPQWAAWVPVYNNWKLLEIGGQQGFWAVLALIPFVNLVAAIFIYISMYQIGLKLQKESWFVILAIFLPLVWLIWLAFDDSKWDNKKGEPSKVTPVKKPTRSIKSA